MVQISKKVVLIGHFYVGKTSLIQQFVYSKFSEEYLMTIGVNIEKKSISINNDVLNMIIWDIAGDSSMTKITHNYVLGAHGIIYVFDLTRESTWLDIEEQIDILKKKLPNAPIIIIGNKYDLVTKDEASSIISRLPVECNFLSSAKTGENVDDMFIDLGKKIIC